MNSMIKSIRFIEQWLRISHHFLQNSVISSNWTKLFIYLYGSIQYVVVLPMVLKMIEVVMKSKITLLTFLEHIASLVVNN